MRGTEVSSAVATAAPVTVQETRQPNLVAVLEREGLLIFVLAAYASMLLTAIDRTLWSDGWLGLIVGREVVEHGLPRHDVLTLWTFGHTWVDQQWLAQAAMYGLARLGGVKAPMIANIVLALSALTAAVAFARRAGASPRAVVWITVPALVPFTLGAGTVRTQSFTYVLFVALLWLLAADGRRRSRTVLLTLPLIVLWGNLHGSAVLAAGTVSLYGAGHLIAVLRGRSRYPTATSLLLAVAPWLALLGSPYAFDLPGYYASVIVNPGFRDYVGEWAPTTLSPATAVHYLLAGTGIWIVARSGDRLTLVEKALLFGTLALSFIALRYLVWFGLAAVCLLPPALDSILSRRQAASVPRLNRLLASLGLGAVGLALVFAAARSFGSVTPKYPPSVAALVASEAGPHGRVLASELYADWLLWSRPELRGRIAFDARFELLSQRQLVRIQAFRFRIGDWRRIARGYRVLVLDGDTAKVAEALVHGGDYRMLVRRPSLYVVAHN